MTSIFSPLSQWLNICLCIGCTRTTGCVLKQCAFALNFQIFPAQEPNVSGVTVLCWPLRRLLGQQGLLSADWWWGSVTSLSPILTFNKDMHSSFLLLRKPAPGSSSLSLALYGFCAAAHGSGRLPIRASITTHQGSLFKNTWKFIYFLPWGMRALLVNKSEVSCWYVTGGELCIYYIFNEGAPECP